MWCLWLPDCCSKEHSTEQLFYKICFSISLQIVHGTTTNRSSRSHALGLHLLLFYTWQITHFYQSVQMGWPPQESPPGAMFFVVNLLRSQSPQRATRATQIWRARHGAKSQTQKFSRVYSLVFVFILCCLRWPQGLTCWPAIALVGTCFNQKPFCPHYGTLVPEVFFRRENIKRQTKKRWEKTSGYPRCESHYHATITVNQHHEID